MKLILSAALVTMLSATSALAFWDVQNSGKDVFGNVNVTASSVGDNGNLLRFECGSSSEPFLVFLLRDSSGSVPDIPAKFIHADEANNRFESDATLTSWNDKYVAIKVTDPKMLRRIAEHMVVATKSMSIGVSIPISDFKQADTFSSRGSTAAGKVVLKNCINSEATEKSSKPGDAVNLSGKKSTVEYHYGFVVGVWDACLQEQLPSNTGHILDLVSTAVQNSYVSYYDSQNLEDKSLGESDAFKFIAENSCSDAAQAAIERLPAKY